MNRGGDIYYKNGKDAAWEKIGGALVNVSVSADGNHIWGVNRNDDINYKNGKDAAWEKIGGVMTIKKYALTVTASRPARHYWCAFTDLYHTIPY